MPATRIRSDFVTNSTTSVNSRAPDVTVLADGKMVMLWESDDSAFAAVPRVLRARMFNPDGTALAADFAVAPSAAGSQYYGHITALASGGFVATWAVNNIVSPIRLLARVFDANGAPIGAEFTVNTDTAAASIFDCDVVGLADGRFIATWSQSPPGAATDYDIHGRVFNANGAAAGQEFIINTTLANRQTLPAVASLADGGFAAVWESNVFATSEHTIRVRVFDANGVARGPDFTVSSPLSSSEFEPDVAALDDGRFIVTWGDFAVRAQIFNADGTAHGASFTVSGDSGARQWKPVVAALADGRIAIAWESFDTGDGSAGCIRARVLNADGSADEPDFIVNDQTFGFQVSPSIAALNDGSFVVSYRSYTNSIIGPVGSVYSAIFKPAAPTGPIYGTAGDDSLAGTNGNNTIYGLAGSDYLEGREGNDVLDGGAGNDFMRGGPGEDAYFVDDINDTTDEATGGGGIADYVYSSVSFTAVAGIENLVLTGIANVNATGRDGQGEFLKGNSGNNILDGRGGADYMMGGLGEDAYFVDSVFDVTDETGGGGVADYVYSSVSFTTAAGIENLVLTGIANVNATGRDGQGEFLKGNSGNNLLDGKGGADYMMGGLGEDAYFVDSGFDVTDESTGGGGTADFVYASVSYTAAAGIEGLVLTGAANLDATGRNGQSDYLAGNGGANILNGRSGNDFMRGGMGDDTYYVDNLYDVTDEVTGGGGLDRILSAISFTSQAGVERLYLTGSASINAVGVDGQRDYLIGNSGNNYLDGKSGGDTLWGGLGNDTLRGGAGGDYFRFASVLNAANNVDTIADFSAASDTIQLDNAIFTTLAAGPLAAARFKNLNLGAADNDDRILYNDTTGTVFYDADGSGAAAAVQFAVLTGAPTITAADFIVY